MVLTASQSALAVLLCRAPGRERWVLPSDAPRGGETMVECADRLVRRACGTGPAWMAQIGAFGDGIRHPRASDLSVCYVALVPMGSGDVVPAGVAQWHDLGALPVLAERQREMVAASVSGIRDRMDIAPVAFRLLPASFTLSELQHMYELLLGRRLHKASFRRALQAAWLVEPTDEWRSEGRGRPAQLYRYAPRRRRRARRGVRFELLGS